MSLESNYLSMVQKKDISSIGGAALMAAFAGVAAWRWLHTGLLFFSLLCFRDILAAFFFLFRRVASQRGTVAHSFLAYFSTALPLAYVPAKPSVYAWMVSSANLLAILGFLVATLATIELGTRMAVSPSIRGSLCYSGIYRWLRHPMYTGYIIAEMGWILLNPINVAIFCISLIGYLWRMRAENFLLIKHYPGGLDI